jgi:hypothetical protein
MTSIFHPAEPRPRLLGVMVIFAALLCCPSARANTAIFSNAGSACGNTSAGAWCQALSYFGTLTASNTVDTINGTWQLNGGVGISPGSTLKVAGTETFTDIVDFSDAIHATNGTCAAAGGTPNPNLCGGGKINTVAVASSTYPARNTSLISAAKTQLNNIETQYLDTLSSSVQFPTSSSMVNIETGAQYNSSTHVAVYKNASTYTQSGAITIGCGVGVMCNANDMVIVLLSQSSGTVTFKNNIFLAGGLTSDQVVFYVPSAAFAMQTQSAYTLSGDFFFKGTQTVTLGTSKALTIDGRIYGGAITYSSSGGTQNDLGVYTPEPGTWASFAGGAAALLLLRRRRSRRK